jgi:hypothetical protein
MRKDFYVYFHRDRFSQIFYVGKGTGRRAWSTDRHPVWKKYVTERLGNEYQVEIYREGLTEAEAEELESSLIAEYGEKLINWINPGRAFDYQALERYHRLRDENRRFVAETRPLEKTDLAQAVIRYRAALTAMRKYEAITTERGIVAEMGVGPDWGDPNIIDRLTLCLIKLKRPEEAIAEAERYFADFPSALNLSVGKSITDRIEKLRIKTGNLNQGPSILDFGPPAPPSLLATRESEPKQTQILEAPKPSWWKRLWGKS